MLILVGMIGLFIKNIEFRCLLIYNMYSMTIIGYMKGGAGAVEFQLIYIISFLMILIGVLLSSRMFTSLNPLIK